MVSKFGWLDGIEWEKVVSDAGIEIVEKPMLKSTIRECFKNDSQFFLKLDSLDTPRVPFDGQRWSFSGKGLRRHQPTYRKVEMFGIEKQVVLCVDYNSPDLRKECLEHNSFVYCHYFLMNGARFNVPDAEEQVAERLTKTQVQNIRKLLEHRTSTGAYKLAIEEGLNVKKKQVQNQLFRVETAKPMRTGARVLTKIEELDEMNLDETCHLEYHLDPDKVLCFKFFRVFPQLIQVYLAGCPSVDELEKWNEKVEQFLDFDIDDRRKFVREHLHRNSDGIEFHSRLFIDTTYNLGDSYVTLIMGELNEFITKSSKKNRVVCLAFMIHSKREMQNHTEFAEFVKSFVNKCQKFEENRLIPVIITDGEKSLSEYSRVFGCNNLRCDVHLLSNLNQFGKSVAKQSQRFIFGKMENETWKSGLLGCYDTLEFTRILQKLKQTLDPRVYRWLKTNQSTLVSNASGGAKLRAGILIQYNSTNISENTNKHLKDLITKRLPASKLVAQLDSFCHNEMKDLWNACAGKAENVAIKNQSIHYETIDEKKEKFTKMGIPSWQILLWNLSTSTSKRLNLIKMEEEIARTANYSTLTESHHCIVIEDKSSHVGDPKKFINVCRRDERLWCPNCHETLPSYICSHLFFVLDNMEPLKRSNEIFKLEKNFFVSNRKYCHDIHAGAKLSDRHGSRKTASNNIRNLRDVTRISILHNSMNSMAHSDDDEQQEEEEDAGGIVEMSDGSQSDAEDPESGKDNVTFFDSISSSVVGEPVATSTLLDVDIEATSRMSITAGPSKRKRHFSWMDTSDEEELLKSHRPRIRKPRTSYSPSP